MKYRRFAEAGLIFTFSVMFQASVLAAPPTKKADLDLDGIQESVIHYAEDRKILKVVMDKNHDGKIDGQVTYRDGFRDFAEIDSNFDGKIDTVVMYYFTGVPAVISVDRSSDGKPDRWTYFKNGVIYKREWDRNFDGAADYRILFSTEKQIIPGETAYMQSIVKQYDDDYDSVYERSIDAKKKTSAKRVSVAAGSLSEEQV